MKSRYFRFAVVVLSMIIMVPTLTGCWDHHELNSLFIVTGVAIDKTETEGKTEFTLQVGKALSKTSSSGSSNQNNDSVILFKTEDDSVTEAVNELNKNSNRKLFLQHEQVLLLGVPFAQQGIIEQLDMFMRNMETRIEIPMVVVEGNAEKALSVNLKQDKISSMYITNMLTELSIVSPVYNMRIIDFASQYLAKSVSPVIPVVTVEKQDDTDAIKLTGMAVFKADKMVSILTNNESMGYVWGMGDVKDSSVTLETEEGKAVMNIVKLSCKRNVTLAEDESVKVDFSVMTTVAIDELNDFKDVTDDKISSYIIEATEKEIKNRIVNCFKISQGIDADIFGIGVMVQDKYTKKWSDMENSWDDIYRNVELNVDIKVKLTGTGQIMKSLEMEKDEK